MSIRNLTVEQIKQEQTNFMIKVYGWMSFALIITGLVAMWTATKHALVSVVIGNDFVFWGLLILELVCVFFLSASFVLDKITPFIATLIFILYSALNGLTLSVIFLVFTTESIATTFYVTAGTFAIMSIYGYFTKTDLTTFDNLAFMGLIGLIIASLVNYYFDNDLLYWIITYVGVAVFVVLTATNTQKIKKLNIIGNEGTDDDKKESIMGALTLYLDFINLFLKLLRIFGKRK